MSRGGSITVGLGVELKSMTSGLGLDGASSFYICSRPKVRRRSTDRAECKNSGLQDGMYAGNGVAEQSGDLNLYALSFTFRETYHLRRIRESGTGSIVLRILQALEWTISSWNQSSRYEWKEGTGCRSVSYGVNDPNVRVLQCVESHPMSEGDRSSC